MKFRIDGKALGKILRAMLIAASDSCRPRLDVVHVTADAEHGTVTFVATKATWLLAYTHKCKVERSGDAVVPRRSAARIAKLRLRGNVSVISEAMAFVVLADDGASFTAKLEAAEVAYPDWRKSMPVVSKPLPSIAVDGALLSEALDAIARLPTPERDMFAPKIVMTMTDVLGAIVLRSSASHGAVAYVMPSKTDMTGLTLPAAQAPAEVTS